LIGSIVVQARRGVAVIFAIARIAAVLAVLPWAVDWRAPELANVRGWALPALIALPAVVIATEIFTLRSARTSAVTKALSVAAAVLAVVALGMVLTLEGRFQWQRREVMSADPDRVADLGRHLVVGYRDFSELTTFVERRAIAGVYIARRNVQDRSEAAIRSDIDALQAIRRRQGLRPLLIATDQEGGMVSRLSPPLPIRPSLASVVSALGPEERRRAVQTYAAQQAQDLKQLGVNVNFAPVVDLNHGVVNPNDRLTRISQRSISSDPQVVSEVAATYCAVLTAAGVHCTLKHFPGIGRVFEDTHMQSADLTANPEVLAATDWVPFRALARHDDVFMMLAHVRLRALDRERPASFSPAVVGKLLRGEWGHDGILITDDFSMGAVYYSPEGIGGGGIEALNAGIDLILISYDPEQFYAIMQALLTADRGGRLDQATLAASRRRLDRVLDRRAGVE